MMMNNTYNVLNNPHGKALLGLHCVWLQIEAFTIFSCLLTTECTVDANVEISKELQKCFRQFAWYSSQYRNVIDFQNMSFIFGCLVIKLRDGRLQNMSWHSFVFAANLLSWAHSQNRSLFRPGCCGDSLTQHPAVSCFIALVKFKLTMHAGFSLSDGYEIAIRHFLGPHCIHLFPPSFETQQTWFLTDRTAKIFTKCFYLFTMSWLQCWKGKPSLSSRERWQNNY